MDLLRSGQDPVTVGGGIAILANSNVHITDQDSLTTGGEIEGAGVNSTVNGTIGDTITVDPSAVLTTFGSLNVAAYTTTNVQANAYVTTYGLAGVGVADASINLTSNQTINVDPGTTQNPTALNAFHDVNVDAGDYVGLGVYSTLAGSTQAIGYVRGLIAVPAADATTTITSNASVNIGSNAYVLAGQNVGIDAYHGSPSVSADGAGHGFELGFIPVTDGGGDPSAPVSSTVTINGSVVAGQYVQMSLTVNGDGTLSEAAGGAPFLYSYNSHETTGCAYGVTASCIFDPDTYSTLAAPGYVNANPMAAITIGGLFAAGGDVEITTDTLHGSGSVSANGTPSITITDAQPITLIFSGGATIPNLPGGIVSFNGLANAASDPSLTVAQNHPSTSPGALTITLTNNGASTGGIAPDVVVDGPLDNPGGTISITNNWGSLVYQEVLAFTSSGAPIVTMVNGTPEQVVLSIGNTNANEQITNVPAGALIANLPTPGGEFIVGENPADEYAANALYPGTQELYASAYSATGQQDSLFDGTGNALWVEAGLGGVYSGAGLATMYVASSIYLNNLTNENGGGNNLNLNTVAGANSSSPNINSYLYGNETGNAATNTDQLVLFGTCGGGLPGNCASSTFGFRTVDNYAYQPVYVQVGLTRSLTSAYESTSGSANGQIVVGSVMQITASVIDINGTIYAGPATNYNITIPSLVGEVVNDGQALRQGVSAASNAGYNDVTALANANPGLSSAIWNLYWNAASTVSYNANITGLINFGAGTPASQLSVTYNNTTNQITVSDNDATNTINAYSTGASIKLVGDIISSNTLGQIHINSGFGQVSVVNDTSLGLVLPTINTGVAANTTALSSSIMIVDRLKDQQNHTSNSDTLTYVYTPSTSGGTTVEYQTSNGAKPLDAGGDIINSAQVVGTYGASATYNPVAGATYEYVQEAVMQRTITSSGNSAWNFISGIPGDPWMYVKPGGSGGNGATSASNELPPTQATGMVIIGSSSEPAYQETIFGNIMPEGSQPSTDTAYNFGYQGYDYASHCQGDCSNGGGAGYSQFFPADAFIRISSYVRADNQITLNFGGNATGLVNIQSNGAVIFGGNIANVDGTTSVAAGGTVTEATGVSVSGESIALSGSSVGSAGQHFQAALTTGLGSSVGDFSATASNGGVYVNLESGANGFVANASGGDVVVNAQGSLLSGSAGFHASGANVTLTSLNGQIGSAATPLSLQTASGGVANVAAHGDIGLTQPNGNLLVGVISSAAGDVTINVPNGAIYDSLSQTAASSLSPQQVNAIAQTLDLIGGTGGDAAAGAAAITSFQNTVVSDLTNYSTFLANGSVTTGALGTLDSASLALYAPFENSALVAAARVNPNGNAQFTTPTSAQIQSEAASLTAANGRFTLSSSQIATFRPRAAAALGITDPTAIANLSATDIQAWANAQYQSYATTFAQAYGAGWQNAIAPMLATQAAVNPALTGYKSLAASGTVTNGVFTLNAGSIPLYSAQAAAAYNEPTASVTDTQAYANSLYQSYASTLSGVYGANWQTTAASMSTYGVTFTVAPGSALATSLTSGASWTAAQLVQAVDVSALQPASTVVGSSATANIAGNNVTLNIGGAIGSYNPTGLQISLSALENGTLSQTQLAALEVATTPGQISLLGTTASGGALVAGTNLTNLPQGATVTGLNIAETSPVFINARAAVKVTSGGSVYLEGTAGSSISLNQLIANGAVDLQTPGGISVASSNGTTPLSAIQITTSGDLDLVASTGSIGSSALPLVYSIGGALANASAGSDSYLVSSGHNALIERDFAGGTASITTPAGFSILSDLSGVNIAATNLVLNSGGAIGATSTPLAVLVSGALSGSAQGLANISAPTVGGNQPNALTISTFTASGNISLEADSTLTIQTLLRSTAGGLSTTSATLVMASGSSIQVAGGLVTLDTSGDATLGAVTNTFNPAAPLNTVTVLAGGTIWSNADGLTVTTAANGLLSLTATEGIGSVTASLMIDAAPLLAADATGIGSTITISDAGALDASQIQAVSTVTLSAASMNLGSVSSGGTQTITATGALSFTSLTTTAGKGGDIDVTSHTASIQGGSVSADGWAWLSAATSNEGMTVTATNGYVTLLAGVLSTSPAVVSSSVVMNWSTVNAGTQVSATSGGSLTLGSVTSGMVTASNGDQTIDADGAINLTIVKTTDGTLDIRSYVSTADILGSATSNGTLTIEAYGAIGYATLQTTLGDIDLTSDTSSITGTSPGDMLEAASSFDLEANGARGAVSATSLKADAGSGTVASSGAVGLGTAVASTTLGVTGGTIEASSLTTQGGAMTLTSTGPDASSTIASIDVATISSATTLGATAQVGGIALGSATSGGTQTIKAKTNVAYTRLSTSAGDIDLTATSGTIEGVTTGSGASLVADSLDAKGSFDLEANSANGSINATSLKAETGTGTAKSSGAIALASVMTPEGVLAVTSTGSTVALTSATSGGTQTIIGQGAVGFTTLTTSAGSGGDVDVTSQAASIQGGSVSADGSAKLTSATSNTGATATATNGGVTLAAGALSTATPPSPSTAAAIDWTNVNAGTSLNATSGGVLTLASVATGTTGAGGDQTIHATGAVGVTTTTATAGAIEATSDASTVTIGSATSSGTQTIIANGALDYTTLSSTAGDIDLTSNAGSIAGIAVGATSDGLDAHGSFDLGAATTISGTSLKAETAKGTVKAGGAIDLAATSVATTLGVTSTGDIVALGSTTSSGLQTIEGKDEVSFTQLTTRVGSGGGIDVTSDTANIQGGSVSADGSAKLTSATSNDGATVTATNGGVTLVAGSLSSPSTTTSIDWTNVNAGTSLNARSGGALTLADVSTGTTGAGGDQTIHATGAVDLTTTKAKAGTISVTSDASTVTIGSATSSGTQTILANGALGYTMLKTTVGDIDLTSQMASIAGVSPSDTLEAQGSFDLNAGTTISGTSLKAETGKGVAVAGGAIDLATTNVATTLGLTSTGDAVTLGAATSGGTQAIVANGAVAFTTLTTAAGKGGDVDVTSQTASIQGGSVSADGSASLTSATSNDGATATATNGSVTLTAGSLLTPSAVASIDWTNVNAGTSLNATSGGALTLADVSTGTTGAGGDQTIHATGAVDLTTTKANAGTIGVTSDASTVTIGSATSSGTQTIVANGALDYTTLKTTIGDIDLTSQTASIAGVSPSDSLDAHGSFDLAAATTISGTSLKAETGKGAAKAGGAIDLATTNVATTLGVTSTGDAVTLGSATSGGTQTILANKAIGFTTLTTAPGKGGDIDATSQTASIAGGSLSADGSAKLTSATSNDGVTVTATKRVVTLSAGGLSSPAASASIDWTNVNAGTSLNATSGGALTLADVSSGTTGAGGAQAIHAAGAVDVTTTTASAGTIGVTSDASTVTIGSATSNATQTIRANGALDYTTLKTTIGDIDLTSQTASIAGVSPSDTLDAHGSFDLAAATTISGTLLQADTGNGTVKAGGAIDLQTTNIATTLDVTSTGDKVTLGSATSGGTQTIAANGALNYTTLQATAGDIDLTSQTASIAGASPSDRLDAHGSFDLAAATTISGTLLQAETGNGTVTAGGAIDLQTTNAATTLDVTSTGDKVTLGSATSGGTQTIAANGALNYTTLQATAGDIDLTSQTASITGASPSDRLDAHGSFDLAAATTISGTSLQAETGNGTVKAGGAINLQTTNVATTLGVTSDASTVTLGSAMSSGTQTIAANGALDYTTLKSSAGDIALTSTAGSIAGTTLDATTDSLDAQGSFTLAAATTISATSLTAETGGASVKAGGAIDLGATNIATTLGLTSTGDAVTLGSAMSGGTQKIIGEGAVAFMTLISTGGDVDVTSKTSSIAGVTLTAQGAASLSSFGDNTGSTLTTETGGATLTSQVGKIDWTNLNVATTLQARAKGGAIDFGSATSGGTQTLTAQGDIVFSNLTTTGIASDPGDVDLTASAGAVRGGTIDAHGSSTIGAAGIFFDEINVLDNLTLTSSADIAGQSFSANGSVAIDATGTVSLTSAHGADLNFSTSGSITMNNLTVSTAVNFGAANLNIGVLSQAPGAAGPLTVSITGDNGGGVGNSASRGDDQRAERPQLIPFLRETKCVDHDQRASRSRWAIRPS